LVKHGRRGVRLHEQEGVKAYEDLGRQLAGDPRRDLLEEAVEGSPDEALEFAFRG
jgi:hypothetical protein